MMKRMLMMVVVAVTVTVQADEKELIAKGKVLFMTKICFTCHQTDPAVPAPAHPWSPRTCSSFGGLTAARSLGDGRDVRLLS